jgi:endoglucanase
MKTIVTTFFLFVVAFSYAQKDTLFMGINVAGAEFGQTTFPGVYGTHYTFPSIDNIKYYASKKIQLLRLPFRWERLQPSLGGNLDAVHLNYITSFVDSCASYGIKVILDMHNFGRYRIDTIEHIVNIGMVTRTHFADVWKKIAAVFKDKPNIYAYCLMNEPNDMGPNVWMFTAQETINAIRTIDTKTQIHINGDRNSSAECWQICSDDLKYLRDPSNNLAFDAHVFFDKDGLGYYNSTSYDEAGADVLVGIKRIQPFIQWLQANGKKGFIGSFGVPYNDARWVAALDTFVSYINSQCINGCYWAGGPWWGDYKLSIEPFNDGSNKPQMNVLQNHLYIPPNCSPQSSSNNFTAANTQIFIYPTPFKNILTIDAGNCDLYTHYEVYDMTGRLVAKNKLNLYKNNIALGNLQNGWYVIRATGRNIGFTQKVYKTN